VMRAKVDHTVEIFMPEINDLFEIRRHSHTPSLLLESSYLPMFTTRMECRSPLPQLARQREIARQSMAVQPALAQLPALAK
jgi:hypothetical protein